MSTDFAMPSIHAISTPTIQSKFLNAQFCIMYIVDRFRRFQLRTFFFFASCDRVTQHSFYFFFSLYPLTQSLDTKTANFTIYSRPTKSGLYFSHRNANRRSLCILISRRSVGIFDRTLFGNRILRPNYWYRWNRPTPRTTRVNWASPNENAFSQMKLNWTFTKKSTRSPVAWRYLRCSYSSILFVMISFWMLVQECRLKKSMKLCHCIAPFYKPIGKWMRFDGSTGFCHKSNPVFQHQCRTAHWINWNVS